MKRKSQSIQRSLLFQALKFILTTSMTDREIEAQVGLSKSTINRYRNLLRTKNITDFDGFEEMSDKDIYDLFNKTPQATDRKQQPDWEWVASRLDDDYQTIYKIWLEDYYNHYNLTPETGMTYEHFCDKLRQYRKSKPSMRKEHRAGALVEVDWSGDCLPYTCPFTGTQHTPKLFVAVLPRTGYAFACLTQGETAAELVRGCQKMFAFYGGVTGKITPDNTKAAVIKPRTAHSDPFFSALFEDFTNHYMLVRAPARPYKPKDKGAVEGTVGYVQRYILSRLDQRTFHSFEELDAAIAEKLEDLNNVIMSDYQTSRRERFERLEKHALRALPDRPYDYCEYVEGLRVPSNHCVTVKGHNYMVPYELIGECITARLTHDRVYFFHQRRQVADLPRSDEQGETTFKNEFRPPQHAAYAEQNPVDFLHWAQTQGGDLLALVEHYYATFHPEMAYEKCRHLKKLYEQETDRALFQRACKKAMDTQLIKASDFKRLLGMERSAPSTPSGKRSRTTRTARPSVPHPAHGTRRS